MKILLSVALLFVIVFSCFSQENQNNEIGKITSGKFTVHKVIEKGHKTYKFETASKPWPVEFKVDGNKCSEILIKRAGIIDENYSADLLKFPAYYSNPSSEIVISVIDKKIYYYKWSIKTGASIVYILSEKSVSSYETEKNNLDEYRRKILPLQENARQDRIEAKNELVAEEAAQNTLDGKNIKSINVKLVDTPGDIGLLTIVAIGVEITLENGEVLKTKNLGGKTPYTDFIFEVSGGAYAGGDFKVANDSREIPGDAIVVIAKSKYGNSSVSGKLNHPINYKSEIFYQYQGRSGSFGRGAVVGKSVHGGNGTNGREVNISAELQTINGVSVNEISITDSNSGELLAKSKLHVESKITVNVNGGSGGNGADGRHTHDDNGGNGGDGGDAGNVTLTGSGSTSLDITVLSRGGKGGAGGKGENSYNSNGTNGTTGSDGNLIRY